MGTGNIVITASACFGALSILTAACADVTGNESDPVAAEKAAFTAPALKGAVAFQSNGQLNRCIKDVPNAFASLNAPSRSTAAYISKGGQSLPPSGATLEPFLPLLFGPGKTKIPIIGVEVPIAPNVPHIQSVTRFDLGDQDDRWLAVSRAFDLGAHPGLAGFFLVNLPDMDGADGGALMAPNTNHFSPIPPDRATQFYYPTLGAAHPGGMQAFGHYLAVAVEALNGTSFVDIYDFSDGFGAGQQLQRVVLNWDAPGPSVDLSITGVAMTRLQDNRLLMFVLGKDSAHHGWFFVSRDDQLPTTWDSWDYFDGNTDTNSLFGDYQNVNFVTDCTTGAIYMAATGNSGFSGPGSPGTDYLDFFRLDSDPTLGVHMTSAGRLTSFGPNEFDTCSFRAGANVYTGKDNRLFLYCHAYTSDQIVVINHGLVLTPAPTLDFVEFTRPGCLQTEVTCGGGCCDSSAACIAGACCAAGDDCGSTCCGGDSFCADRSLSLCCGLNTFVCGGGCCNIDQECIDNVCQDSPPPPPPPPPPPGSCPPNNPPCSTLQDCPGDFNECNGGCCNKVH